MSDELNEQALERAMMEMMGHKIALHPTKLFMPIYPHETDAEYAERVEKARQLLAQVGFEIKDKE